MASTQALTENATPMKKALAGAPTPTTAQKTPTETAVLRTPKTRDGAEGTTPVNSTRRACVALARHQLLLLNAPRHSKSIRNTLLPQEKHISPKQRQNQPKQLAKLRRQARSRTRNRTRRKSSTRKRELIIKNSQRSEILWTKSPNI